MARGCPFRWTAVSLGRLLEVKTMTKTSNTAEGRLVADQKVRLGSLVSYHSGSVVSRTLVEDKAGTVTLFAFDEGQGLSEHTAPYDALLQLLEGQAEVTVAGTTSRLAAGDGILLPAGKPHAVRA